MKTVRLFSWRIALMLALASCAAHGQSTWTANSPYPSDVYWSFDFQGTPTHSAVSFSALRAVSNGSGPVFRTGGMLRGALKLESSFKGYRTSSGASPYKGTAWIWMAFVYIEKLKNGNQTILLNSGTDGSGNPLPGVSIVINNRGTVLASVGSGNRWQAQLYTPHVLGPQAWHHIALAWTGSRLKLYEDGILESSVAYSLPPQWGPELTFGGNPNGGSPIDLMDGAIDEVKLINFVYGGDGPVDTINANIVQHEYGIALRNRFLRDLAAIDPNGPRDPINPEYPRLYRFASPSFDATSEIRAAVNSFFRTDRVRTLPLDPLGFNGGWLDYVYPQFGGAVTWDAKSKRYNSLYASVVQNAPGATLPPETAYCDGVSYVLWAVYRAMGYTTRKYSWTSQTDVDYDQSHALTEIWLPEWNQYVMQDATYNVSGVVAMNGSTRAYSIYDLPSLFVQPNYSPLLLTDGGYRLNPDPVVSWNVNYPGVNYARYFSVPVSVLPAFAH